MQRLQLTTASNEALPINDMYQQLRHLINQYLKASSKLKKIERMVFKRFAPSIIEVRTEFQRLAYKFTEAGIHQYAGMCHIGQAKCHAVNSETQEEANEYLRAARSFVLAHNENSTLHLRFVRTELCETALHCYHNAVERVVDGTVMKASIIREMKTLQENIERTSLMDSDAHRLFDMEMAAEASIRNGDYLSALHQYDDIVDNIYERNVRDIYTELLRRVEVLRILLLVSLNLTPARQSPAHIKLIEYYYNLANFEELPESQTQTHWHACDNDNGNNITATTTEKTAKTIETLSHTSRFFPSNRIHGEFVSTQQQYALAEIIYAWSERRMCDLMYLLKDFSIEFKAITSTEREMLERILAELALVNK